MTLYKQMLKSWLKNVNPLDNSKFHRTFAHVKLKQLGIMKKNFLAEKVFNRLGGTDNITKPTLKKKIINAINSALKEIEVDEVSQLRDVKYYKETYHKGYSMMWESKYGKVVDYTTSNKYYDDWTLAANEGETVTFKKGKYYVKAMVIACYSFIGIAYFIGLSKEINHDADDVVVLLNEVTSKVK